MNTSNFTLNYKKIIYNFTCPLNKNNIVEDFNEPTEDGVILFENEDDYLDYWNDKLQDWENTEIKKCSEDFQKFYEEQKVIPGINNMHQDTVSFIKHKLDNDELYYSCNFIEYLKETGQDEMLADETNAGDSLMVYIQINCNNYDSDDFEDWFIVIPVKKGNTL